jgi:YggT family protein
MLNNVLIFLLQAVLGLLVLLFLLRFYFQLTKVSFQQQAAQIIVTLTNFAVKPARKVIPSFKQIDLSTLFLAYLTQLVLTFATLWLKGFPLLVAGSSVWLTILLIAVLGIVSMSISIFMYAVLIQAILSWINPYTPIAPVLDKLTYPVLRVLRKLIPSAGSIDLTPLVFIIAAQLILTTILLPIENSLLAGI